MSITSEPFSHSQKTAVPNHHRFERIAAFQSQGPEVVRMLARVAWSAISMAEKRELIYDAVGIFGSHNPEKQNAYLNTRLITRYLDGQSDTYHDFHEDEKIRVNEELATAFGGDASNLPPVA